MEILPRVTAGTNERRFKELMLRASGVTLLGKRRFWDGDVEISVDESLKYQDTEYLIEIDSANMAKLLVGQYVLLNQLHKTRYLPQFFLIIHAYKNYNPMRTVHNLELVNQQLYQGKGIEFGVIHFDQLQDWNGNFQELLLLMHKPQRSVNPAAPGMSALVSESTHSKEH
jgi:hypothetical protein